MHVIAAFALAFFLIAAGIAHFIVPGYFRTLVPSWLGFPGALVAVSGAAEIVVGALILVPHIRAAGGWAAAVLITGYLASHFDALYHARRDRSRLLERPTGAIARVVVNLFYIGWAVAVALAAAS